MDPPAPNRRALAAIACRGILLAGCAVLASCSRDSGSVAVSPTTISIKTALVPEASRVALSASIDRLRVAIVRPPAEVIAESSQAISPGQTSVTLDIEVELSAPTEELLVRVELWAGQILVLAGERLMVVDASLAINQSPVISLEPVAPELGLSATTVDLVAPVGSAPAQRAFSVRNLGGGVLSWSGSSDQPWLSISPASGVVGGGASTAVTAVAGLDGLAAGVHSATLTIADPAALESPQQIAVTLTVTEESSYLLVVEGTGTGSGRVTSSPAGIDCSLRAGETSGACSHAFSSGTRVLVLARAIGGSSFAGWSGAGCTSAGTCTLVIEGARTVTAGFAADPSSLSVVPSVLSATVEAGTDPAPLSIDVANGGGGGMSWVASADATWIEPSPTTGVLESGSSVTVAVKLTSSDLGPGEYSGSVTVSASGADNTPQTVAVRLKVAEGVLHPLHVEGAGSGEGRVRSILEGIDCGVHGASTSGDCDEVYPSGTSVTLLPEPASGSTFTGWSGACSGTGACQVTMDQARAVTAAFGVVSPSIALDPTRLSANVAPGGELDAPWTVRLTNVGGGGLEWIASDDADWLSVVPPSGALAPGQVEVLIVSARSADLGPGNHQATLTVTDPDADNSPQSVAVALTVDPDPRYRLTTLGGGSGTGTIASTPVGIDCTAIAGATTGDCTEQYPEGTLVTLAAVPANGSSAAGWSGAGCSGTQPCTVSMDQDQTVTATFEAVPPVIGLQPGSFVFTTVVGQDPQPQILTVTNSGGG
ncbi:MAG: hypothetical protein P8170_22785, partial [Gemmatimonadota bacterium]